MIYAKVILIVLFNLLNTNVIQCNKINIVGKEFKSAELVPDVITTAPKTLVEISFKESDKNVHLGNELTPTQVKTEPSVSYDAYDDRFYTLIMTDPDAPSRKDPTSREWLHWLVVNIPGSKISRGDHRSAFVGSGPPLDTGLHRYAFLVYQQPSKLVFDEEKKTNTNGNRGKFSTKNFAEKYHLGNPIAGNFYTAQYDDYVPTLHKQLGF